VVGACRAINRAEAQPQRLRLLQSRHANKGLQAAKHAHTKHLLYWRLACSTWQALLLLLLLLE
jgi:hypothetical protein